MKHNQNDNIYIYDDSVIIDYGQGEQISLDFDDVVSVLTHLLDSEPVQEVLIDLLNLKGRR